MRMRFGGLCLLCWPPVRCCSVSALLLWTRQVFFLCLVPPHARPSSFDTPPQANHKPRPDKRVPILPASPTSQHLSVSARFPFRHGSEGPGTEWRGPCVN